MYQAEVFVTLKSGVLDPQGATIQRSLESLGYDEISGVRVGKYIQLTCSAGDEAEALRKIEEISRRLLSNPVIEDYRIELRERAGDG